MDDRIDKEFVEPEARPLRAKDGSLAGAELAVVFHKTVFAAPDKGFTKEFDGKGLRGSHESGGGGVVASRSPDVRAVGGRPRSQPRRDRG